MMRIIVALLMTIVTSKNAALTTNSCDQIDIGPLPSIRTTDMARMEIRRREAFAERFLRCSLKQRLRSDRVDDIAHAGTTYIFAAVLAHKFHLERAAALNLRRASSTLTPLRYFKGAEGTVDEIQRGLSQIADAKRGAWPFI